MLRGQANVRSGRGFTLIELLVVVSIIALLISILLPSLSRARKQAQLAVCSSNVRSIGLAVNTYASERGGKLPGPVHPAIYRRLVDYGTSAQRNRFLLWLLRGTLRDTSGTRSGGVGDKVSTCPTLASIVPDSHFSQFNSIKGWTDAGGVHPSHYAINNVSGKVNDAGAPAPSRGEEPKTTAPPDYFGYSPPTPSPTNPPTPPVNLGDIKNASREWMIADAWYRSRVSPYDVFKQEGPFQSSWSGEAFPNFAPHMRKGSSGYTFSTTANRVADCGVIRQAKADGVTATAFFDGHAAPVRSKAAVINGNARLFYGFPGTMNPLNPLVIPPGAQVSLPTPD
jgi:prepilin-type N-terminal cleavage/methylation domain-containing protein